MNRRRCTVHMEECPTVLVLRCTQLASRLLGFEKSRLPLILVCITVSTRFFTSSTPNLPLPHPSRPLHLEFPRLFARSANNTLTHLSYRSDLYPRRRPSVLQDVWFVRERYLDGVHEHRRRHFQRCGSGDPSRRRCIRSALLSNSRFPRSLVLG